MSYQCVFAVPFTICILRNMMERLPASALRTVQVRTNIIKVGTDWIFSQLLFQIGWSYAQFLWRDSVTIFFTLDFSWISFSWESHLNNFDSFQTRRYSTLGPSHHRMIHEKRLSAKSLDIGSLSNRIKDKAKLSWLYHTNLYSLTGRYCEKELSPGRPLAFTGQFILNDFKNKIIVLTLMCIVKFCREFLCRGENWTQQPLQNRHRAQIQERVFPIFRSRDVKIWFFIQKNEHYKFFSTLRSWGYPI